MGVAQNCKSKCFARGKRRKLVAFTTFRVAPGKNGRKGVCEECKEKEANAGIVEIYYGGMYRRDERIFEHAPKLNISLIDMASS